MKSTVKNITIKIIPLIMIGIMGIVIANKAVFLHLHILNDGTIIEHAHPYNKSDDSEPYKTHHHSNDEFLFFQNSEILFLIVFLTLALIRIIKNEKHPISLTGSYSLICLHIYRGRAPPVW